MFNKVLNTPPRYQQFFLGHSNIRITGLDVTNRFINMSKFFPRLEITKLFITKTKYV